MLILIKFISWILIGPSGCRESELVERQPQSLETGADGLINY